MNRKLSGFKIRLKESLLNWWYYLKLHQILTNFRMEGHPKSCNSYLQSFLEKEYTQA